MKLEETLSPAGALRYQVLRKVLRIITKHGLALETISNWALGIVGLGCGFIIANIANVDKHVSLCSRRWLFVLMLLSGMFGCVIKWISGLVTFDLNVEGKIFRYIQSTMQQQAKGSVDFDNEVLKPVNTELLVSRPLPFRLAAKKLLKSLDTDILHSPKMGARLAQWMMLLLFWQLLLLAAAGILISYEFLWRNIK